MENRFLVLENRGCGIEYIAFSGTKEECAEFIGQSEALQAQEVDNGDFHNGNGDPFSWEVISEKEYDEREAKRYASVPFDANEMLEA